MRKKIFLAMFFAFVGILNSDLFAQNKTISGVVLSAKDSLPISGVSVVIDATNKGVISNSKGEFQLKVSDNVKNVVVKSVGYTSFLIDAKNPQSFYKVYLKENSDTSLNEVVVTALGTKVKKIEQGFASTTLDNQSLTNAKSPTLAGALAGKVPGLQVFATGGGVNPNYNIIIRGQRSLLGNNQPLLILDGSIVTYDMLGNLNPEDVDNVNVLNGPAAVALYGSQASNGALVITTKRPAVGTQSIHVGQTETFEHVAFFPKEQKEYGGGGSGYGTDALGNPLMSSLENESYGPKYDGHLFDLGMGPLENGDVLQVPYSYFKDRNKFWQVGVTSQSDFSLSSADANSSFYMSGQFISQTSTDVGSKYTRASVRVNGTRKIGSKVNVNYNISYLQNRYNQATYLSSVYDEFLNMPGEIPITQFKDWQHNEFANPNGYFNPWYPNPYFELANNRTLTSNDYLTGSLQVKYSPITGLDLVSSTGYTMRTYGAQAYTNPFNYTAYATAQAAAYGGGKNDILGSVSQASMYKNEIVQNFFANYNKRFGHFSVNAIAGFSFQQDYENNLGGSVSAMVDSGLYNLGNSTNTAIATNSRYRARNAGAYYDVQFGWKDFLFLHTTGRQDWVSILDPGDRTFFYPSVDASFVLTKAIKGLSNLNWLDMWKIRSAVSKVGQVDLSAGTQMNPNGVFGAYQLTPIYFQANGYPYNGVAGEEVSSTLIQPQLKPEMTTSWEVGTDFTLFHGFASANVTWFDEHTKNQTVPTTISIASGYSNYLLNAGETQSAGLETGLKLTPIQNNVWTISLSGTYSYYDNKVLSIPAGLPNLYLNGGYYGYAGNVASYALPGYQFPEIMGQDYVRHNGKVVVDAETGMPQVNNTPVPLGNANTRNQISFIPTITWKALTLEADFEYRGGFVRYNDIGWDMDWSGMGIRTTEFNRQRFVFPNSVYQNPDGSWTNNTSVVVSESGNGNGGFWTDATENMDIASNYVSSGNYWKLRELSLTYTFQPRLLAKTKCIKSATVSFVGRNLFIWLPKDNYYTDPDYSNAGSGNGIGTTGYQQPPSRFYGFNLSVNF